MEKTLELLIKAVKYDNDGRRVEALSLYTEGINKLLEIAKNEPDPLKKQHFQKKVQDYLTRAEKVKELQNRELAQRKIVKQIHIAENSKGFSYDTLFGKYLDENIMEIIIEEPYLSRPFQIYNLITLLELFVRRSKNLKIIKIITKVEENNGEQQMGFDHIRGSLKTEKEIKFIVECSNTLHDRSIVLDNGYTIKLGRGIHFFKRTDNKYDLGNTDNYFRHCFECNIDVFYSEK